MITKEKKSKNESRTGFTIIELSLSIAFIAILSITVVLIITDTVSSYRRGLTLNLINTTGMDVVDDIRGSIQSSSAKSIAMDCGNVYGEDSACKDDNAQAFVLGVRNANVAVGNDNIDDVPVYGIFCTGSYSYLWNSGYFFDSEAEVNASQIGLKYRSSGGINQGGAQKTGFKLLKVKDTDRAVCKAAATDGEGKYTSLSTLRNNMGNEIDITSYGYVDEEPTEVLSGENNLALYDLTSAIPTESENNKNTFYSVSFILGTVQGGINIKSAGNYCATPGGYNAVVENFDYCAINKFNFAAQAVGG